jgi:hypothetical protein
MDSQMNRVSSSRKAPRCSIGERISCSAVSLASFHLLMSFIGTSISLALLYKKFLVSMAE